MTRPLAIGLVVVLVVLAAGVPLAVYGTLSPCGMLVQEVGVAAVGLGPVDCVQGLVAVKTGAVDRRAARSRCMEEWLARAGKSASAMNDAEWAAIGQACP